MERAPKSYRAPRSAISLRRGSSERRLGAGWVQAGRELEQAKLAGNQVRVAYKAAKSGRQAAKIGI